MHAPDTTTADAPVTRKPREDEIDVHGVTHPGKVRKNNQDHFALCSLRKQLVLRFSSIPDAAELMADSERLASLAMVADGVGGAARGETASRMALQAVTRYVSRATRCYFGQAEDDDQALLDALQEGARHCHEELIRLGEEDADYRGMATTLTLYLGVWPRGYLLQVGDSRCYVLRGGQLTQISRDQTMAQDLIDQGVLTRTDAFNTRWANVLASAIGGSQTMPVVTQLEQRWGDVGLLCSDGLTRHVSDARIRERLSTMTSSKQACEGLIEDALAGGGTDNVTVLVGRTVAGGP